jgi:hypothetical protein
MEAANDFTDITPEVDGVPGSLRVGQSLSVHGGTVESQT